MKNVLCKAVERVLLFCLLAVTPLVMVSCGEDRDLKEFVPARPNYDEASQWYTDAAEQGPALADVFYICPTTFFDRYDSLSGLKCHYLDTYDEKGLEVFQRSQRIGDEVFGKYCDYYSPRYRQVSLDSFLHGDELLEERFDLSMEDVCAAFDYFWANRSHRERPFIVAGYSQGGKATLELLKRHLTTEQAKLLVGAYVIGYRVTAEDLRQVETLGIHGAEGEKDCAAIISYNSVREPEGVWPVASGGTVLCINPVNWRTDAVAAPLPDEVTVTADPELKLLVVKGYTDVSEIFPGIGKVIPEGNYHLAELSLYEDCLRENTRVRTMAWRR